MIDIYDESTQHLQEIKREAEQALRFLERIENMFRSKKEPEIPNGKDILTGNITDLEACENGLDKAILDSLAPETREQLLKNLEQAERQGLIKVDFSDKKILLTDKGKEFISRPEFEKQLGENLGKLRKADSTIYSVELNGTERDLLFFKNHKTLDLKGINFDTASEKEVQKFAKNLKSMSSKGLIELNSDMKISLTEKGANLIKSAEFTEKFGGGLTEKALSAIPQGKLAVVTKEVLSAAKQVVNGVGENLSTNSEKSKNANNLL